MYDFNVLKMLRKYLEAISIFSKCAILGKFENSKKKKIGARWPATWKWAMATWTYVVD